MASYAAVISLKNTIHRLLNSSRHSVIVLPETDTALISAYQELESLQAALRRLDDSSGRSKSSERVSVLDRRIQDALHRLEDELELEISSHFLPPQSGGETRPVSSTINEAVHSFAGIKKEYMEELSNPTLPEKDDAADSDDFGGEKSKLVGVSVEYNKLKHHLIGGGATESYRVVSLVGMAGIGKTALARSAFKDTTISDHFQCQAWVRVGQTHHSKEIVLSILDQVTPPCSHKMLSGAGAGLRSRLMFKRYLLVLDDVWETKVWDDLARLLPKPANGSRLLVTTRLEQVPKYISGAVGSSETKIQMRLLDKEKSWCLFRDKVFGEELCTFKLEKAGKKIAEKCDGLPLTIVTVAALLLSKADKVFDEELCPPQLEEDGNKIAEKCDGLPLTIATASALLLSEADKTAEYWNKVADERESSVFVEAYDQISKVLIRSYNYLPQHLKAYFIYMAVFPQNYEISALKLFMLWIVEGFVENVRDFPMEYLGNLVSNNILMVHQRRYDCCSIKTCSLHSAFWQLCIRIAGTNKFLYVVRSYYDDLVESIQGQRRLCVQNNVLFGIKDVYNSMASISAAHSLLCTGQRHQYPVTLCLGLRLLRVLDALTVRFYEFPMEVVNLVHLRYLSLTYNRELPASISKLWNLLFLIVRQHLIIRSPTHSSYLPVEIWDMKELMHLQTMGSDLPDPPNDGALLENLETLLDVSPHSVTSKVFRNIPGLMTLGIRIELGHDAAALLSCFDNLSGIRHLDTLICEIVNPILMPEVVAPPPALLSTLPSRLHKLSLSGFGYGWENMRKIAALPNLGVLKLRCYAFRGPEWRIHRGEFYKLEYLLIEDTDLVRWSCDNPYFPRLKRLTIRHCYTLKQIPQISQSKYSVLQMIEVVDSNPAVVSWAKQEREEVKRRIERSNVGADFGNLDSMLKVKEMWSD